MHARIVRVFFRFFFVGVTTFLETWKCEGIVQRSGKRHKVRERSGICVVVIVTPWQYAGNKTVMCMDTCSEHHITYLYFIRTLMRFAYLMFSILS